MWKDPIVEEVRKVRDEYAARFNYDLDAMLKDLQEKQEASGREVVNLKPRRTTSSPEGAYPAQASEGFAVADAEPVETRERP
jgi:hypothetical protein